jgi:NAD-dependent dihydropyrimidine dehydrogenase PreA subunit
MGVFINVTVEEERLNPGQRRELATLCPVDIFQFDQGRILVREEQVDECTLCELCLDAAPAQAVRIRKNYKDEILVSRGSSRGGGT